MQDYKLICCSSSANVNQAVDLELQHKTLLRGARSVAGGGAGGQLPPTFQPDQVCRYIHNI